MVQFNPFRRAIPLLILLSIASAARGEESPPDSVGEPHMQTSVDETHPIYAVNSHWVESMLVAVGGLFLAAAVIGPIVRAEAPDAVPAAMSHEEDPAADQH